MTTSQSTLQNLDTERMCQDTIRDYYFISTIKLPPLGTADERYETIVVHKKDKTEYDWGKPVSQVITLSKFKARAAHRRALKDVLAEYKHGRRKPDVDNVYTHPDFWE